jgi:hypothetical protein
VSRGQVRATAPGYGYTVTRTMRWALGLVALLIAALIVLELNARAGRKAFERVSGGLPVLQGEVPPRPFDAAAAVRTIARLAALLDEARPSYDELRDVAAGAAAWAAGTAPGSGPYRAAVKIRSAADELAIAGVSPDDRHRLAARRHLGEARAALTSDVPLPGGPAGAIRDQLENLQRSQQERLTDAERSLE